jgi:membrane associated rhomboid family serine protease
MVFFWILGNNVEDVFGRFRFLLWYLAARGSPRRWRKPS